MRITRSKIASFILGLFPTEVTALQAKAWRSGAKWMQKQAIGQTLDIEAKKHGPQTPSWCCRLIGEIRLFKYNPYQKWDGP